MKFHEAANIFPLDKEHLDSLAEDIKNRGLEVPIEILGGEIIDGRRRWLACEKAGIEPDLVEVDVDDPIGYVLSLNLHRRQLSVSQMSRCSGRAEELQEKLTRAAKDRQKRRPVNSVPAARPEQKADARDQLGKAFGISGRTVERERKVRKDGIPELGEAIDAGTLTVNKAATIASQPKKLQRQMFTAEKQKKQQGASPKSKPQKQEEEPEEGKFRGVGTLRANEAINCLIRIPRNDRLRKRGFQIVTDWIKANP